MHEFFNGQIPAHFSAMCLVLNVALLLSITALIKYLVNSKCGFIDQNKFDEQNY
jgi:hypothetical protein